jgi:branched-chain amino acid transport system permease protein
MDQFLNVLLVGILLGGIYGTVAIGLNVIFGIVRLVNFAHGELLMLGMYGAWILYSAAGITPYAALLVIGPLMFVFGLLLQRFVFGPLRDEPNMQVFASFGLLILMQNVALCLTGGQSKSIDWGFARAVVTAGSYSLSLVRLVALLALTATTIGIQIFLSHTMAGKAVRAVIQDHRAARAVGINVERTYYLAFGTGAALAGIAGALLLPVYSVTPWIGGNFVLAAFAVVVLGGLGSVWGAYLGGLVVGIVEAFAGFYVDPGLRQAIWFAIFILMLVVRPYGLLGVPGTEELGFRDEH